MNKEKREIIFSRFKQDNPQPTTELEFSIYPNPSNGNINIESDFKENSIIQITDLAGNSIKTIHIAKGLNKIQIKNLPSAFYFVKINEKVCEKIVVR